METAATKFLFLYLLLSILIVCSTGMLFKDIEQQQVGKVEQILDSWRREVVRKTSVEHDFINSPIPTNPVTVTVPPDSSSLGIVTVPAAVTPTPATTTNPTVGPPTSAAPQSWCVAKSGVPEASLQAALDYACGIGKADCSAIQQGASCYNPIALQNHASYAFNSYYQKSPLQTSCDFGGTAMVTNINPSSGSCIYTTRSSSTSPTTASPSVPTPTTASPSIPTPTTASSSGATPIGFGSPPSNPAFGGTTTGFGETPAPTVNTSVSDSTNLNPFICCIIVLTSIIAL